MSMQPTGGARHSQSLSFRFAPASKNATPDRADQLDKAGHTILRLLHKAAGVAEANSQHALQMAQKLSHQLRTADSRIAELEAEVGINQEKADRAEQWLHQVYTEIEEPISATGRRSAGCDWGSRNGLGDAVRKGFVRTSLGVARITSATRERPLTAASRISRFVSAVKLIMYTYATHHFV